MPPKRKPNHPSHKPKQEALPPFPHPPLTTLTPESHPAPLHPGQDANTSTRASPSSPVNRNANGFGTRPTRLTSATVDASNPPHKTSHSRISPPKRRHGKKAKRSRPGSTEAATTTMPSPTRTTNTAPTVSTSPSRVPGSADWGWDATQSDASTRASSSSGTVTSPSKLIPPTPNHDARGGWIPPPMTRAKIPSPTTRPKPLPKTLHPPKRQLSNSSNDSSNLSTNESFKKNGKRSKKDGRRSKNAKALDAPPAFLDHTAFPHIMDEILKYEESWIGMRSTSKEYFARVSKMLYRHIVISAVFRDGDSDYSDSDVASDAGWEFGDFYEDNPPLILDVSSPTGPLPDFRTHTYSSRTKGWDYSLENEDRRLFVGKLLSNYTEVIDVPAQLHLHDILGFENETRYSRKVVRIYYNSGIDFRSPNDDHMLTLAANKTVLFPDQSKMDSHCDYHYPDLHFIDHPIFKLVSHVIVGAGGPYYFPVHDKTEFNPLQEWCTQSYFVSSPVNDLVYVLTLAPNPPQTVTPKIESSWRHFAAGIALHLYYNYMFRTIQIPDTLHCDFSHAPVPTVTLVDFPEPPYLGFSKSSLLSVILEIIDAQYKKDLERAPSLKWLARSEELGALLFLRRLDDNPSLDRVKQDIEAKIRFMTREEYAATLEPGEWELEELPERV